MSVIVVIDAGHGISTPGKRCLKALDPAETREWFLNDRIADRVQELLAGYDVIVLRADDTTGVKDIPLSARVKTANNAVANLYVSIHHNAGIAGGTGGGTVVYYSSDSAKVYLDGQKLYNSLISNTGLSGNRSEKVKKQGFYVIRKTNMESFLIECGYMDSRTDTPIVLTPGFAEQTAKAITEFIVAACCLPVKTLEQMAVNPAVTAGPDQYQKYTGKPTTLVAALNSLGIPSTYTARAAIAKANGIVGYVGTATQNTQMYNLLKAGLLKKG